MSNLILYPSILRGEITIPPSKSMCHRGIICAGLSQGLSNINNISLSEDIIATLNGLKAFGANTNIKAQQASTSMSVSTSASTPDEDHLFEAINSVEVIGRKFTNGKHVTIDCGESGSTLRFLIPIAAALGIHAEFCGNGRLGDRPLKDYYNIFDKHAIKYHNCDGKLPLTIEGKLNPGEYRVSGNVSSQFITGLLFALPLLDGPSRIIIDSKLESRSYVDMTIQVLHLFSVEIINNDYTEFIINGNQCYKPCDYTIEGDFSQAAFWIVAGLIGNHVNCLGLDTNTAQGDKAILDIVQKFGGMDIVSYENNKGITVKPHISSGTIIDGSECPDLIPIVTVLAALSLGKTEIINAARLRLKESDRLKAMATELNKIGANIIEKEDGLEITGVTAFSGGIVDTWNDHRIAMAMAIASTRCTEPLIIKGSECVKKSYPNFWEHYKALGGKSDEWNVG